MCFLYHNWFTLPIFLCKSVMCAICCVLVLSCTVHIWPSFRGILSGEGCTACSVWRRKLGMGGPAFGCLNNHQLLSRCITIHESCLLKIRNPQIPWDVLLKSQPFASRCSYLPQFCQVVTGPWQMCPMSLKLGILRRDKRKHRQVKDIASNFQICLGLGIGY